VSRPFITREEWRELYILRDELEDPEDRRLMRRLLRYTEGLEKELRQFRREPRD
jgi:hypothetical protein